MRGRGAEVSGGSALPRTFSGQARGVALILLIASKRQNSFRARSWNLRELKSEAGQTRIGVAFEARCPCSCHYSVIETAAPSQWGGRFCLGPLHHGLSGHIASAIHVQQNEPPQHQCQLDTSRINGSSSFWKVPQRLIPILKTKIKPNAQSLEAVPFRR